MTNPRDHASHPHRVHAHAATDSAGTSWQARELSESGFERDTGVSDPALIAAIARADEDGEEAMMASVAAGRFLVAVVRKVVGTGHRVTVLIDPVAEPEASAAGAHDVRVWRDAPHHATRLADDDYIRDWAIRSPARMLTNLMDTLMVRPAAAFADEVLELPEGFAEQDFLVHGNPAPLDMGFTNAEFRLPPRRRCMGEHLKP